MRTVLLKSLKHKARIAGQLSLRDWLALLEAWWLLLAFYLTLHWMSYERLSGIVQPTHNEIIRTSDQVNMAQRLGRMVALSARLHLLPMTCLVKALTLRWVLSRRGIQSRLCIGANKRSTPQSGSVDKSLDRIHAHAWVEVQGQAIGDSGDNAGKFQLLASSRRTPL